MKTTNINLARLLNAEHLSLSQKIVSTLKKHSTALPDMTTAVGTLERAVAQESKTFEAMDKSEFTKHKTDADLMRDNAARQLHRYVLSFEWSDNPDEVAATALLRDIIGDITGIIAEANERETVLLDTMVKRLREEPFAAAISKLKASDYVEKVADKNAAFDNISQQQTTKDSGKDAGNMSIVRKQVDDTVHRIFRIIQSRYDLDQAQEQLDICVNELNYDIREAKITMKQRLARLRGTTQE